MTGNGAIRGTCSWGQGPGQERKSQRELGWKEGRKRTGQADCMTGSDEEPMERRRVGRGGGRRSSACSYFLSITESSTEC